MRKETIEQRLDVDIAVSNDMSNAIKLWNQLYTNNSPWLSDTVKSMNVASAIASEMARLVTIEFESAIEGNEYLNEEYQEVLKNIRNYTEFACAKGGLVFKPYASGENIEIDLVQAERFFPTSYNSRGEITSAVFVEFKHEGKKLYTRLEHHQLTEKGYRISNSAYVKENHNLNLNVEDLGQKISLSAVDEWHDLEEEVLIENVDKPLFSYFKVPLANSIDYESPLGVSVFSRAIELIAEVDRQYSRTLWEFEGTELAINASLDCFKRDNQGKSILPEGRERLYRSFEFGVDEWNKAMEVFSPDIRDTSLFNGLNQLLRKVEFNCGLAYGTLSDITETDKTATEVKASKQRSYATVKDIQNSLKIALENLVYAMDVYAKLYGLPSSDYEITFNFDDSLVMDKDAELTSMLGDVSAGILKAELYIMKKYGVDEKTARNMMPNVAEANNDPFGDVE
ncbi:MAG: phage portal protein [Paraclostridium sp.]